MIDIEAVRVGLVDAGNALARMRNRGELDRVRWAVFFALWLLDAPDDDQPDTCAKCERPALRVCGSCVSHATGAERHLAALARVSRRKSGRSRPVDFGDVGYPWRRSPSRTSS